MWFISNSFSLLIPLELLMTGKHCFVSYTVKTKDDERNFLTNIRYVIYEDKNNYPVLIQVIKEQDPSDDYSFIREFHFTYQIIE